MADLTGHSIGRYQILERLGESGMATVYKAHDTRLEREVAFKVIRVDQFGSAILDHILKRFEREAKSLARLSHPSIVTVYDYGEHNGAPYLVLEYCPGGDLKSRLRGQPMDWREAVRLILPVARALRYSHRQGVIHRDVKPSNIMFTEEGEPKLSDFGIAKILEHEEAATLTGTGVGIGTPGYMAPEQWTGETSPQSDQYGLGVVLYELVTGRKPYESDTPAGILIKQTSQPLPLPSKFTPAIPPEVEAALLKSLERDPAMRYAGMAEFIGVFEELLQVAPAATVAKTSSADPDKTLDLLPVAAASRTLTPADWETTVTPIPDKKSINWKMIALGGVILVVLTGIIWGGSRFSKGFPVAPKPSETPTHKVSSTPTTPPTWTRTIAFTPTTVPASTATPTAKPTPLGGGRIGFVSNRSGRNEVYSMLPDGSQINQIAINVPEGWSYPYWDISPDGRKFAAFTYEINNNDQVYIMNLDGSENQSISLPCNNCRFFGWFPDGKKLILEATRTDLGTHLYYYINLDGSNLTELTDVVLGWGSGNTISLSPDGNKVAYVAESGVFDAYHINIANTDLSGPTRITSHTGAYRAPIWSKEGNELLYIKEYPWNSKSHGLSEIHSIGVDGSNEHIIIALPFVVGDMTLSPDGKRMLLFRNNQKISNTGDYAVDWSNPGMYVVDLVSGELMRITKKEANSGVWSPDGTKILFSGYNDNREEDVYIVDSDGTDLVNLTNQPAYYGNLAWLPEQ